MAWRWQRCSPGWDGRHEECAVKLLVVLTTEANQAKAEALAAQLLEQRLAACIALQQQKSLYHWQGRIEQDSEVQLVIKTNTERWKHWRSRCTNRTATTCRSGLCCQASAPRPTAAG